MRRRFFALLAGYLLGAFLPGAASASVLVDYNLSFTGAAPADIGSGTLVLSLPSFPDNNPIAFTNLPNPIFVSLTATIGASSFSLTNTNIAFGGVQGTSGSSIDIAMTESTVGLNCAPLRPTL